MQAAGEALQQAQQQLAQAGQQGQEGQQGQQMAQGGGRQGQQGQQGAGQGQGQQGAGQGQTMAGGDSFGADGGLSGKRPGTGVAQQGAGPEAGHGTTNQRGGTGAMGNSHLRDRQSAERPKRHSRFEQVYAPERIASQRRDTQVRGKQGKGKADYTTVRGAPEQSGSYQPYYDVYSSYRHAAEDALSKEDVPATYKKQVRDYFDSLRPQ